MSKRGFDSLNCPKPWRHKWIIHQNRLWVSYTYRVLSQYFFKLIEYRFIRIVHEAPFHYRQFLSCLTLILYNLIPNFLTFFKFGRFHSILILTYGYISDSTSMFYFYILSYILRLKIKSKIGQFHTLSELFEKNYLQTFTFVV